MPERRVTKLATITIPPPMMWKAPGDVHVWSRSLSKVAGAASLANVFMLARTAPSKNKRKNYMRYEYLQEVRER